jgi:hypothetical protein
MYPNEFEDPGMEKSVRSHQPLVNYVDEGRSLNVPFISLFMITPVSGIMT